MHVFVARIWVLDYCELTANRLEALPQMRVNVCPYQIPHIRPFGVV